MPLTLIIKSKLKSIGRTDHERVLKDEGWGGTMTEEQADKCEFLERKAKAEGIDRQTFIRATQLDKIK